MLCYVMYSLERRWTSWGLGRGSSNKRISSSDDDDDDVSPFPTASPTFLFFTSSISSTIKTELCRVVLCCLLGTKMNLGTSA